MPSTPSNSYIDANGITDAEKYLTAIHDGDIIACRHMRKLAEIMLPRFHEPYKRFHYDPLKATRPVEFIERYTCFPEGEKMGKPFILEDYERAAIEMGFGFVDDDGYRQHRQILMALARKNGKALGVNEEIPTPDGWKLMKDIHPGDYVFGQDGKPSKVLVESEIFDKPMYLVAFEDGATIKASGDHIWTVRDRRTDSYDWVDLTTAEMFAKFSPRAYCVPLCRPVEYPTKDLPSDPYEYGYSLFDSNDTMDEIYLTSSAEQRITLTQGINRRVEESCVGAFKTRNETLAHQVQELYSSLGKYSEVEGDDGEYYVSDGVIGRFDERKDSKFITSIKKIPNEPSKCIAIDNSSHLYLAGRQYTATHNTSLLAAIMLYMLTSDTPLELGGEIYCCATGESQARKCFGAADAMRLRSPALAKRIRRGKVQKRGVSGLNYDKTGSFLVPLAASLGRLDGLSASGAVVDELGAFVDNGALLDLIEESMSARKQGLTWIISTENYVRENIWDERLSYAHGWLKGEIHDDTFLPILYTLDSESEIDDESCWPKANPGLLCGVKDWQYLRDRVNRAKQSPRSRPSLLIKEFNLRANSAESFLDYNECHNPATFEFNPETDRYGIVAFDLAKSGDISAAICLYMRAGDDRIYEIPHFWICEEKVRINGAKDFKEQDAVPYHLWAEQETCGFKTFTIVEGDKVDQKVVIDWIKELADMGMYTRFVGYDDWHVDDWTKRELEMMVGKENFEAIPQHAKVLSPAMVEHQIDLRAKRIINPCPTTEWCRANVMSKPEDSNGNYFPQKKNLKHNKKIDGYMAEIFAYIELRKHQDEYLQLIGWYPPETN